MWFRPQDSELLPQYLDVSAYFKDKHYTATRDLRKQGDKRELPRLSIP